MGVYGSFLTAFPELFERIDIMTRDGVRSTIKGIYIPSQGDEIDRKKETSANWVGDTSSDDSLFVSKKYAGKIDIGTYVYRENDTFKVVKKQDYKKTGSFIVFNVQRIQGATLEQDKPLEINQGVYH